MEIDHAKIGKNSYDFAKGRRKLKLQIRLSPSGKTRDSTKVRTQTSKKRETGVAASHLDYPTSTNVSSPIQAASRRRIKQKSNAQPELQFHRNGYSRDDVVVDDDGPSLETEDESEDGFGPIIEKGQSRSLSKRALGPPITIDEKLERLNAIHRMVVEDFLQNAKELSQKVSSHINTLSRQVTEDYQILFKKSLKGHPFTDTILREMAINFPQSNLPALYGSGALADKRQMRTKCLRFLALTPKKFTSMVKSFSSLSVRLIVVMKL